jgi:hypothetical protein
MWDRALAKKVRKGMSATEQLGGLTKVGEWWVLESGERAVV